MDRKNKSDARIVSSLLSSKVWLDGWRLVPISDVPQSRVAEIMRDSVLFLSFGHPEGFGLPLVESSACGCGLIGYSGNGGREIFDFHDGMTSSIIGLNDWSGFIRSTEKFLSAFQADPSFISSKLKVVSDGVLEYYSFTNMRKSVVNAFQDFCNANF